MCAAKPWKSFRFEFGGWVLMRYSNSPIEEKGTSIMDFCFRFVSPSRFEVSIKHCLFESEDSSSKMSAVFGYVTFSIMQNFGEKWPLSTGRCSREIGYFGGLRGQKVKSGILIGSEKPPHADIKCWFSENTATQVLNKLETMQSGTNKQGNHWESKGNNDYRYQNKNGEFWKCCNKLLKKLF